MGHTKKIIVGSGLLLLASGLINAGPLPWPQTATTDDQQTQAAQASDEEAEQTETSTTVQQPAPQPATAPQPASGQIAPATGQAPSPAVQTLATPPGLPPGTTTAVPIAPAGVAPGTTVAPGTVPPPGAVLPGAVAPGTIVPGAVPSGTTVPPPGVVLPGTVPPGTVAPGTVVPGTAAPAVYVPKTEFDNTPHRFNMTQDGKRMSANDFDAWMRAKGYRVAKGAPPADCPSAPPAGVETIVGPDGCPVEVSIELDGVTFEFAKSTLRSEAKKTLDQAIEILKRHPELTVEVAGHTDSRGDAAFNQKLSQVRAKAVYDYMIENGIAARQLEGPTGYGESKPIASNDTDAGREENRRTELNIKAVAALPAPTIGTAPTDPVVVPATTGTSAEQVAAPATTGTASGAAATPAASEQGAVPAPAASMSEGADAPAAAIETTAAGHVIVPATGGTTETGHVIKPATTGTATGQTTTPTANAGVEEQTAAPATAADQQADVPEEESASEAESASGDDEQ